MNSSAITLPVDVLQGIESLDQMPTLPAVANQVLSLGHDSVQSFKELEAIIEGDPALAAAILKVANSPFYRLPGGVANIARAVMVLGLAEIRRICLGVTVMCAFPEQDRPTMDRALFWKHSTACAIAARRLTQYLEIDSDGDEFLAALLHDMGRLVLDLCFHERFSDAIQLSADRGISMRAAEQQVFSTDHTLVGAWLCQRWRFPQAMVDAVRYHHSPEDAPADNPFVAIVYLADLFSRVTGHGFGGENTPVVIYDTPAWRAVLALRRTNSPVDLAALTFQLNEAMQQNEDLLIDS